MNDQKINLNDLPRDIYRNLPVSIRSLKNEYYLSELSVSVQEMIQKYFDEKQDISYQRGYDVKPKISNFSDLEVIETLQELILFRLQNYFLTLPGDYPFNCVVGTRLKYHLQTRNTSTRNLLVGNEIDSIINVIKGDSAARIRVEKRQINEEHRNNRVIYNIALKININGTSHDVSMVV